MGRGLLSKKVCTIPAGTWSLSGKFTVFVNNSLVFNFDVMKECFESAIASNTGFTDLGFGLTWKNEEPAHIIVCQHQLFSEQDKKKRNIANIS